MVVRKQLKAKSEVMRFRMDEKLQAEVSQVARELDRSNSWIVRKAVEEYVARHKAAKTVSKA